MSQPKAKATSMVDVKLKKCIAKGEKLQEENSQLRMSVLNIRQMYEGSIGEKNQLNAQLQNANQILMGVVVGARGKTITIKAKVLTQLGEYAGIDTKDVDGDLTLTALTVAEIEAMQAEIDEATE